jgi:hypothetical protein
VEARSGERTFKEAAALRTFVFRVGGEVLDFLEFVAALGAAIGIQRQGFFNSR